MTTLFLLLESLRTSLAHVSVVLFYFLMFSEKFFLSLSCSLEETSWCLMSSPKSFFVLNSSIFVSVNDVSQGPEQTALILPFVPDKTGFTIINHSGLRFPVNSESFFF